MSLYTASRIYHYPEGVVVPGDIAELSDEDAAHGLESGVLFATATPVEEPTEPDSSIPKE